MVASSLALIEFLEALSLAEILLELDDKIENDSDFRDVLNFDDSKAQKSVIGLRQGILILTVTGFENFLKKLPETHFEEIIKQYRNFDFSKLPRRMQINNVYGSLFIACEGKPYEEKKTKYNRLNDIYHTCSLILNCKLNSDAFSRDIRIPKSDTVKMLFNQIGKPSIFNHIFDEFQTRWGEPIADIFIEGKLDEIIQKRNLCAHGDVNFLVSKEELKIYLKFFESLSYVLNSTYKAVLTNNLQEAS